MVMEEDEEAESAPAPPPQDDDPVGWRHTEEYDRAIKAYW
jgi:hypothetical protein